MGKSTGLWGPQVGVVQAGQAFPVWVRGALLFLRVTSTAPAPVVRLVLGAELAVAPRPRLRKDSSGMQQSGGAGARVERQALKVAAAAAGPPVWLRVLVGAVHRPGMFEYVVLSSSCALTAAAPCNVCRGAICHAVEAITSAAGPPVWLRALVGVTHKASLPYFDLDW